MTECVIALASRFVAHCHIDIINLSMYKNTMNILLGDEFCEFNHCDETYSNIEEEAWEVLAGEPRRDKRRCVAAAPAVAADPAVAAAPTVAVAPTVAAASANTKRQKFGEMINFAMEMELDESAEDSPRSSSDEAPFKLVRSASSEYWDDWFDWEEKMTEIGYTYPMAMALSSEPQRKDYTKRKRY